MGPSNKLSLDLLHGIHSYERAGTVYIHDYFALLSSSMDYIIPRNVIFALILV